jgi:hypothetical protein
MDCSQVTMRADDITFFQAVRQGAQPGVQPQTELLPRNIRYRDYLLAAYPESACGVALGAMLDSAAIDAPDWNRVQVYALKTSDIDGPSVEGFHSFK